MYQAPSNSSIEYQLGLLGSDLRIYRDSFSIGKALLSSLYVLQYPLSPLNRSILETNIKTVNIQRLGLINGQNINITTNILYYDIYYGQQSNRNASRVYYTVNFTKGLDLLFYFYLIIAYFSY